jgi:hypothetical protein
MNQARPLALAALCLCLALVSNKALAQGQPRFDDRYFNSQCGNTPPPVAWLPYLTRQLASESRRLIDDVGYELSGTQYGPRVAARAQAVLSTANYLDQAASAGQQPGSPTVASAMRGFDASLGGMRQALSGAPGVAPQTSRTLGRIERIAQDVRLLTGSYDNPYNLNPPQNPPCDYARLRRATQDLATEIDQLIQYVITSGIDRYPGYGQLRPELSNLRGKVDELRALIDRQADATRLRRAITQVTANANPLDRALGAPGVPPPLVGRWTSVSRSVQRIQRIFEDNNDSGPIPPDRFPPGPFPPGHRPPPLPPIGNPALVTIDRFSNEIEAFLATLAPKINSVPEGLQFQADARNLHATLMRLRQQVANGAGSGARSSLRELNVQYERLWNRTRRVADRPVGPNVERVQRMGAYLKDLQTQLTR